MSGSIDLRSDTVTRPDEAMRRVMAAAEVGDDVLGDDPTVIRLEEKVAELLGKEKAIFVPSGTMGNQLSIRAHTEAGDEIITHAESHIYYYEGGAPAALSGCSLWLIHGDRGFFTAQDVRSAVRPVECHFARSRLIVIENTHNRGGGTIWSPSRINEIRSAADDIGLRMHLDGARLMNASVASGTSPRDLAAPFETISICFSKGLGAPVGSAVAGSRDMIERVHRFRKMFGGGMRQVGILAAAAIHALDHNVAGLADDHRHARRLAEALASMQRVTMDPTGVDTNIVYFQVDIDAEEIASRLDSAGVRLLALGRHQLRAVTHRDVSSTEIDQAIDVLAEVLN